MDTLTAARKLERTGIPRNQAEAIVQTISELKKSDLLTKDHLDLRLLQRTIAIVTAVAIIFGLSGILRP
jgi:hypothetical protein